MTLEVAELGKNGLALIGLLGIGLYAYLKREKMASIMPVGEPVIYEGPEGQIFETLPTGKVFNIIPAPPAPYVEPSRLAQSQEVLVWSNDIAGGGWYSELMHTYYRTPAGKYDE